MLTAADNDFVGAVTFDAANSGNWLDISVVDANSLTLGDVTATGNLNATASTDLVLNGTVSADLLDLTATAGEINQTGGQLSVVTGDSNAAMSQVSAGMLSQDVTAAESANVRVTEPATVNTSTTQGLVISEVDEQRIKMSLCTSSQSSANLSCVSD